MANFCNHLMVESFSVYSDRVGQPAQWAYVIVPTALLIYCIEFTVSGHKPSSKPYNSTSQASTTNPNVRVSPTLLELLCK